MIKTQTYSIYELNTSFIEDLKETSEITIPCLKHEYEHFEKTLIDICTNKVDYDTENYNIDYELFEDEVYEGQCELVFSCYEIVEDQEEEEEDIIIPKKEFEKIKNVLISCWEVGQDHFYEEENYEEINKIIYKYLYRDLENTKT